MGLLKSLDVLLIDCQATGANPSKGHLLEIGWMRSRACSDRKTPPEKSHTFLINLPQDVEIPRQVQKITGITSENQCVSIPPEEAWKWLAKTANEIAAVNHSNVCPAVIHFSRYEEPFLRWLHRLVDPETPFPFQLICTHKIAESILPGLPRKSLRAVAGYFGYTVPKERRCIHHTTATERIWRHAVRLLEEKKGIRTWKELLHWLATHPSASNATRVFPMNPQTRLILPDTPGVYRMRRSNSDLLYIGKAKSLKKRVNSYFQKKRRHPEHMLEMLSQARDLDVTVTESAVEAAILESDDIKQHSPTYNIALNNNNRAVGFCSRDFRQYALKPNCLYPIGPMPNKKALKPISAIIELLESGFKELPNPHIGAAAMGIPPEYSPEIDLFKPGFEVFYERHKEIFNTKSVSQAVRILGTLIWRRRLEEDECDEPESETPEADTDAKKEWIWAPETVSDMLENVICRSFHLIRRARWFCLVSESSLAWQTRNDNDKRKRLIVFEQGRVALCDTLAEGQHIPIPSGHGRTFKERQNNFDINTYDRMRVVTTELRRLISEGRKIALCVRPNVTLRNIELERLLRWV